MKQLRNEKRSSALDWPSQMSADRTDVLSIVCLSLFIIKLVSHIGVAADPRASLDLESLSLEGQADVVWTTGTPGVGADVDFSLQWSTNLVEWTTLTDLVHRREAPFQRESVQLPQASGGFLRIARTDAAPSMNHVLYAGASLVWPTPTDQITRFSRDAEKWTREAFLTDFINHPSELGGERNLGGIAVGQDGSVYWIEIEGDFDVDEPYQAYVYRLSSEEQEIEKIGVVFEESQSGYPSPFAFDVEVSAAGVVYASAQVAVNSQTDTSVETIARFEKVEGTWQRSVVLSDFIDAPPESDRVLGGFAVDESESLYWIVISGKEQIDDLFQGHVFRRDGGTQMIEEIGSVFETPIQGTPSPFCFDIELTENTILYAAGQIEVFGGDETVEVVARFEKDGDVWQRTVALQDFVDPHPELSSAFRLGGIAIGNDGSIYWVVVEGDDQFGTPFQGHVHCQVPGIPHSQMIGSVFDEPIDGFPGDHAFDVELR